MIRRSELSQRRVEKMAGFSKGYLSQLLAQNLDLKVWHLKIILGVFGQSPVDFFQRLDPEADLPPSLRAFEQSRRPLHPEIDDSLEELYGVDPEVLVRLRRRLEQRHAPSRRREPELDLRGDPAR